MGAAASVLSATETVATGFWVGASAGFAFIGAPVTAHEANDLDLQAKITGATLERVAAATYVAGSIGIASALLAAAIGGRERGNALARAIALGGALGLIGYHQRDIVPEMTRLQQEMGGSFKAVPQDDPRRVAYREVHGRSTRAFGAALLLGLGSLILGAARS